MKNLPGDVSALATIERMIRVNHAGEYGAARIYEGQISILKNSSLTPLLERMRAQEQAHLDTFDHLVRTRHVRPTLLSPVWHITGYMLGAFSAYLGEKSALAFTVAVEEVIDEHYAQQAKELDNFPDEQELQKVIHQFRDDEQHHGRIGLEYGAADAPAFTVMKAVVKAASKTAIWLSTRI